jgi:hypothetical protein
VKQHSVNCVAASLYAMTCFDPSLFPPEEAEDFSSRLFTNHETQFHGPVPSPLKEDAPEIRAHILNLYRRFLNEQGMGSWKEPLLAFLRGQPRK